MNNRKGWKTAERKTARPGDLWLWTWSHKTMIYDADFIEGYLVERVTDTHIYLDRDPYATGRNPDILDHPTDNRYELRDDWMYHNANYLDDIMDGKADDWEFHPD